MPKAEWKITLFTNGGINSCFAGENGGGIFSSGFDDIILRKGNIKNCYADREGDAIWIDPIIPLYLDIRLLKIKLPNSHGHWNFSHNSDIIHNFDGINFPKKENLKFLVNGLPYQENECSCFCSCNCFWLK